MRDPYLQIWDGIRCPWVLVSVLQNSKLSHFITGPKARRSRPLQSMPSLRHCLVSSPWPQKSSQMSMSLPRKKATRAHPPMRWVPFHLTSKHRFSELIETPKPPRIIHGIWFPHRQCQDIQIIGLKNRYHDLTTPEGLLEWIPPGELGPFQLCFCVGYAHGSSSIPGLWWPWRRSWGFADLVSFSSGNPCNRWLGITKLKLARTIYLGHPTLIINIWDTSTSIMEYYPLY